MCSVPVLTKHIISMALTRPTAHRATDFGSASRSNAGGSRPTCWPNQAGRCASSVLSVSPPRCLACCNRDLQARISGSLATFQDPRSKGVGARQPYRAIVAVVPFRRVHRARPVAIQPRTSHSAPHWQVCSELLNSVIAMLLVRESNGSG